MRVSACSSSKRNSASARASSVLPTPVGPEEDERADRPLGVLQPGPRAANRVRDGLDGLVLADDALVEAILHLDQLVLLALEQARDRDAGPRADDAGDVVRVDLFLEQSRGRAVLLGQRRLLLAQEVLELDLLAVLQLGGPAVIGGPLGLLDLVLKALELGLGLAQAGDGAPSPAPSGS